MSLPNGNAPLPSDPPTTHNAPAAKFLPLALLLAGVEGIISAFLIGQTRSAEGSVLFGLSAFRLAMMAGTLLASVFFLALAWQWRRNLRLAARVEKAARRHAATLAFIFFWAAAGLLLLALEAYFMVLFGEVSAIDPGRFYERLAPFTGWGALVLFQFSLAVPLDFREQFRQAASTQRPLIAWLVLLFDNQNAREGNAPRRGRPRLKIEVIGWLAMLAVWALAALTGIGLIPDDRFWNVAGVPLLPQQIILTMLLLLFFLDLRTSANGSKISRLAERRYFPYLVMAGLWAASVLVWQGAELQHTYFAPGPYPPNFDRYPFSDARWFDTGGQYALMGEGLNNNLVTDRPFLMLYAALLHALGGQQYEEYILVQLLFLAVIPAGMFLLGWRLHSKTAGFGMGLLVLLKERNAIEAATEVGLVNARVLMSELPTALLLIGLTLLVFRWFRYGKRVSYLLPILAGGVLGLAGGIRTNTLALAPVVVAFILIGYIRQRGWVIPWATASIVFGLSIFMFLLPYGLRSWQQSGTIYLFDKLENVMERADFRLEPAPTGKPGDNKIRQPGASPGGPAQAANNQETLVSYSLRHFVHNEITSVLILPLNWQAASLDDTIRQARWDYAQEWQGELSSGEKLAVGVNLLVLAIGIGFAFRRWQFSGLVPLVIHLGYHISNALSRTSGGRYLAPVDWVIVLYFVLGLLAVVFAVRGWEPTPAVIETGSPRRIGKPGIAGGLFGMALIGCTFLLADLVPARYPPNSAERLLAEQVAQAPEWFSENNLPAADLEAFVNSPSGVVELGLILYPRYFTAGEPAPVSSHLPVMPTGENRITFLLLEEFRPVYIRLALGGGYPAQFPHADYGLVVGCLMDGYIEGKLIIPLEGQQQKPILADRPSLTCPAP